MSQFKKYFLAVFCLGILMIAGALMDSHRVIAQAPTPVAVTNTPLAITGDVHIAGTTHRPLPVELTHMPTVALVPGTTDNPARHIFQKGFLSNDPADGDKFATASFSAPASQRLVIEYVSANVSVPAGQKVFFSIAPQPTFGFGVQPVLLGNFFGRDFFEAAQQVRIYVDPGATVSLGTLRNATAGAWGPTFWDLAGYLVDCTAAPCPPSP